MGELSPPPSPLCISTLIKIQSTRNHSKAEPSEDRPGPVINIIELRAAKPSRTAVGSGGAGIGEFPAAVLHYDDWRQVPAVYGHYPGERRCDH